MVDRTREFRHSIAAVKYLDGKALPVDDGDFDVECGVGERALQFHGGRLPHSIANYFKILTGRF